MGCDCSIDRLSLLHIPECITRALSDTVDSILRGEGLVESLQTDDRLLYIMILLLLVMVVVVLLRPHLSHANPYEQAYPPRWEF